MFYRCFATSLWLWAALWLMLACFPATAGENAFAGKGFAPVQSQRVLDSFWLADAKGRDVQLSEIIAGAAKTGAAGLYVHLWAPSCLPCVKEIKELDAALPGLATRGIAVLAIAQDYDGGVTVPAFARRYGITNLPLYIDSNLMLWKQVQARGLPTTYRIDAQGRVLSVHEGVVHWGSPLGE